MASKQPADTSGAGSPQLSDVERFFALFPDEDKCLDYLMMFRFGMQHVCASCQRLSSFTRLMERRAYSCAQCGHCVFPCHGTILGEPGVPLQVWFYALHAFLTAPGSMPMIPVPQKPRPTH